MDWWQQGGAVVTVPGWHGRARPRVQPSHRRAGEEVRSEPQHAPCGGAPLGRIPDARASAARLHRWLREEGELSSGFC